MFKRAKFEKLLEPLQIKQVRLRNRMVKPAQVMGYADEDGCVNERVEGFYEALAKGGVGLLIVESAAIDFPLGVSGRPRLLINDDKFILGLSKLTGLIHKHGCPTFLQLQHAGPAHSAKVYGGQASGQSHQGEDTQPVAASSLSIDELPGAVQKLPRELTISEVKDIVNKFADGAERAQKAGFDGVELHCAHTYLINSFLSRAWNKREDAYGGDLKNRARFAVEIHQAVRERVGENFVVGVRMNGIECGTAKGLTSEETQEIACMLQEAGADYISVTGWGYGPCEWLMFPEQILYPEPIVPLAKKVKKPGALVPSAEAIKKAVSIPVIAVGRLNPELGEWILRKRKADLIGFARRLMADPELPNKVASGQLEDIAPCTACLWCFHTFVRGEPVRCRINATLGREREYILTVAKKKKRVMVVGGGPAGMQAARVAALRGHEVLLYEKEHKLGGLLSLAALIKGLEIEDLPAISRYLRTQIIKLGVRIKLGKEVDLAVVEQIKPDVVILATGGKLTIPGIAGIDKPQVISSADLHRRVRVFLRFLGPRVLGWLTILWMPIGKRVTIIGGSIQGCETAEFLVKRHRRVIILETSSQLGTGIPELNRVRLVNWLAKKGVTMLTQVGCQEITDKGLVLITKEGERQAIESDTILITTAPEPNIALFKSLEGKVPEIYLVGDCKQPNVIADAIHDGYHIGCAV